MEADMKDAVKQEFEETALLGCKAVRAFLNYQGDNKVYALKARAGAVAMGSYARLRATMANEQALALATAKQQVKGLLG
jgi:hypothetical protein